MENRESSTLALGASIFAISSFLTVRSLRKNRWIDSRLHFGQLYRRLPRHGDVSKCENGYSKEQGQVSSRGEAVVSPPIPYLRHFVVCLQNPCDAVSNPTGHVAMCIAENRLVLDMLAERFMQVGTATATFSDANVYCYNSFLGMPVAREAAAYFLARRFLFPDDPDLAPDLALQHVHPSRVALGAGAASLLSHIFFLLGESGDCCLVPAPYYAAFENDMNLLAGIVPIPVEQSDPRAGPTNKELDVAFRHAKAKGMKCKFILLTNPNNPLGVIYRPEVMARIVAWARGKSIHTVVDEICALSTHKKEGHAFESIIKVLDNDLGNDVHMIWAVSKDFGGSGLRVGLVYSQNERLMDGLAPLSIFTCCSGPIQYLVSELLTDDQFVDSFLDESRNRLLYSYQICTAKLEEMVLPYVPAEAGMFVYVDFSSLLPEKTFEWEERLSDLMFEYARIVLTPGESQRDSRPGWFRICYAWVTVEVLQIAMERLSRLVAKIRRMDWDDLNERSLSQII